MAGSLEKMRELMQAKHAASEPEVVDTEDAFEPRGIDEAQSLQV